MHLAGEPQSQPRQYDNDSTTTTATGPSSLTGLGSIQSRALREAAERKAKKIHFYKNGHPYSAKVTVSMNGRDFQSLTQLFRYLTERTQLHNGVHYVFTTNGLPVNTLQELEHDQSYVISGTRTFHPHPYGVVKPSGPRIGKTVVSGPYKTVREDDLRLLRPLSSKYNNIYAQTNEPKSNDTFGSWAPQSSDQRIVTIINNQDHSISAKVMLNLRTPKSFETLLKDLGQTVRMPHPKRLFTSSGLQVKSVSHLKHDLTGVEYFYIDSVKHDEDFRLLKRIPSLESVERMVENSVKRLNQLASSTSTIDLRPHFTMQESSLSNVDLYHNSNQYNNHHQSFLPSTTYANETSKSLIPTRHNHNSSNNNKNNENSAKFVSNNNNNDRVSTAATNATKTITTSTSIPNLSGPSRPPPQSQHKSQKSKAAINPSGKQTTTTTTSVPALGGVTGPNSTTKTTTTTPSTNNVSKIPIYQPGNSIITSDKKSTDIDDIPEIMTIGKFTQIQEYAERIVAETEVAIRNELVRLSRSPSPVPDHNLPESQQNPSAFSKPSAIQITNPIFKVEINPATPDALSASAGKSFTFSAPYTSKQQQVPQITIEPAIEKKSAAMQESSQNKKTAKKPVSPGSRTPQPERRESLSNTSKLSLSTDNLSKSTFSSRNRSTAPTNKKPYLKRKSPIVTVPGGLSPGTQLGHSSAAGQSLVRAEKHLHKGINPPAVSLELIRIFGYNGNSGEKRKNLFYLATGELAYHCGTFAVLWNPVSQSQRFYCEHDNDILCMRIDSKSQFIASSQLAHRSKLTQIRIWSTKNLATIALLKDKIFAPKITDFGFTSNNLLFVVTSHEDLTISVWNWNTNRMIALTKKTLELDEVVFGGTVHPTDGDIIVTYGRQHLIVWSLQKISKTIVYRTALQTISKISKTIYCADFLCDNSLLTGDAVGNLTIWAPFESNKELEFAIKEVKGHEVALTCLKLTKDAILISGDREGSIKTWDVTDGEFRLINAIRLPTVSGSVTSLALPYVLGTTSDVYVGTSENFVLKGSILQTSSYEVIFEGHLMAVRSIAFDPTEEGIFYTASLDQRVCKWSRSSLIWCTPLDIQAISCSVHPVGEIIAIGSVNGIITILECNSGQATQHLELTSVPIGCLAYSPDGMFLVAGCQDGNLHVLPVADDGHTYSRVSILKGPLPILTLQWSLDAQFILTSVDDSNYQELILWDLPNTRYIRNVTNFSDNLKWHSATCSGLDDARATWDNESLSNVVNICTHYSPSLKFIVTGDENGFVRVFAYPCTDVSASFFEYKQGAGSVTDVKISLKENLLVSCNFEGAILLWNIKPYKS